MTGSRYQVAWAVKNLRTGLTFTTSANDSTMTFRANHPSDAMIRFDNTDNSVTNAFVSEDEVQILMNGILMMDGFIYNLEDVPDANRHKDLDLYIMDWGSYVASKTIFEKDYELTKFCKDMLIDGAGKINALWSNVMSIAGVDQIGLAASNFAVKGRRFQGTYVKDVWYAAAETGGFDYYVDETKKLNAWPFESLVDASGISRLIQIGGQNYQLVDFLPTQPYQLMIRYDQPPNKWSSDVQNKYNSVTVENGIISTFPAIIDDGSTNSVQPKGYAFELSMYWTGQIDSTYDSGTGSTPGQKPYDYISSENVGNTANPFLIPTIHIFVGSNLQSFFPTFQPRAYAASQTNLGYQNMSQPFGLYQKLGFYINLKNLVGSTITSFSVQLNDNANGGFWTRNIFGDFTISNGWVYLEYFTPTTNTGTSNGWAASGSPNNIDSINFIPSPIFGYTIGSHADFGGLNLWGIMSAISSTTAGLPTQQIIVNRNITDPVMLENYAVRSALRSNQTKQGPQVTIDGFDMTGNFRLTDFRKPGYKINIDMTATLGSGRVANNLRIDEIQHKMSKGFTYCTITFDNSFYRP